MKTKITLMLALILMLATITQSNAQHKNVFKQHAQLKTKTEPTRSMISKPGKIKNYDWDSAGAYWKHTEDHYLTYDAKGNITEDKTTDTTGKSLYRIQFTFTSKGAETSRTNQNWDAVNSKWVNSTYNSTDYDAEGNRTKDLTQYWDEPNSKWVDSYQTNYTYDADGNQTHSLSQSWNGSAWVDSWENESTYDAQGNETLYIYRNWQGSAWDTTGGSKYSYTYDGQNNILTEARQDYNAGDWVNDYKDIYTYGVDGKIETFIEQDWDGANWFNYNRFYNIVWHTYSDGEEDASGYNVQGYSTGSWQDTLKYSSTFGAYGGGVSLTQVKSGANWVDAVRETSTYDSHYNSNGYKNEEWDGSVWVVTYERDNIYTYNLNNDITRLINKYWNRFALMALNTTRYDYSDFQYFENTGVVSLSNEKGISIYPNPAVNEIYVGNADMNINRVSIFNFIGENVFETNAVNTSSVITIPVNELAAGIYFIRVTGKDNNTVTGKFVKD